MIKYMDWLEVRFRGGSIRVCPESWWEDRMWWMIGDDAGRVAPSAIFMTFEPFTMDDHGDIAERYGREAHDAVEATLSEFARCLGEVRGSEPTADMWDVIRRAWPGRATEPQCIGCTVARFLKETFDRRVGEVSSILPSGTPVPDGRVLIKEDASGVWAASPEALKTPFRGQPRWYRAAWALMTFDPIPWGDLYFNHLTPEDVVKDALSCPKIPDALKGEQ